MTRGVVIMEGSQEEGTFELALREWGERIWMLEMMRVQGHGTSVKVQCISIRLCDPGQTALHL